MGTLRRRPKTALAAFAALLTVAGSLLVGSGPTAAATATTTTSITVNGNGTGRTFDGVGAISGGGGNSRLLIDYPPAQRNQILDYLFKPGYGADVQVLKLEIGGDANSTDGSEPSIEHARGVVDCNVGYEFWLAEQAKQRNPNIKLYGLAWAAPGWIGNGNFWSQDMINYLMTWLGCAKSDGLDINYLGGWNERGYNIGWYENLHNALHKDGYGSIQVVGADSDWSIADDMVTNKAFDNSVDIVGAHYPCDGGDGGDALTCSTTANALATGKQLWASENGSQDINAGTAALIRSITRGYIDAKLTAYLNWPLIAAIYPNLPYNTVGLAVANQPWSGAYSTGESTWATAQVTQFTQPGWRFVDSASGYLGGDRTNGSYVSLVSPDHRDYSTIVETTTATTAQNANFTITGGLSTGTVHVWTTNLGSTNNSDYFVHGTDIKPVNGKFSLTLQPNHIYSLTTTTGQGKGTATSPAPKPLALPYADNFNEDKTGAEAKYFSDMQGSYEVRPCAGRSGQCLQQMTPSIPIEWQDDSDAFSLVGDQSWGNYTVSSDVRLAQPGTVELLGRANEQSRPQGDQNGYWFRVSNTGTWSIVRSDTTGNYTTLASGTTTPLGIDTWHHLAVTFQGTTITGSLDGKAIGSATDSWWTNGQAGIGVVGYQTDQFDNFSITPGSGSNLRSGPITSGLTGTCATDSGDSATDLTPVVDAACTGAASQQWTVQNQALRINGKCMDVYGQGTADGTPVELWDCNGGPNQQLVQETNGTLVGLQSGKCLEDPGSSTDGTVQLVITDCTTGADEQWLLPR
ncbi:MAG TPA: ricin-type beta-trefoil lectin domain protein [Pseudonocardiaceae bacterium]|nr:ricin-type beta-trefoil lectin domain protein [Pseudonocardiaceae bacterium]